MKNKVSKPQNLYILIKPKPQHCINQKIGISKQIIFPCFKMDKNMEMLENS